MSKYTCAVIFLTFSAVFAVSPNTLTDRVYTGLNRALDYILDNYKHINIDGLFGVVFCQAHLSVLIEKNLKEIDRENVLYLKTKADTIYELIKPNLYAEKYKYNLFVDNVLVPEIWKRDISFKFNTIDPKFTPKIWNFDLNTMEGYIAYLSTSNISETLSDNCLMEVIQNGGHKHRPHNCNISKECKEYMIDNKYFDPTYGITHRLLYLQVAKSQNCNLKEEWYKNKASSYCSYIFWEAKMNVNFGFIEELNDLLLEQITLCGFEGYNEFLLPTLMEHVLDIQTEHGCFIIPPSLYNNDPSVKKLSKRTANVITYGCNDHTTGLGVSTMSTMLRYLL